MKQVLFQAGSPVIREVPAPLVEPGHLLVQTAYSFVSTGTELASLARTRTSLAQHAAQPEKLLRLFEYLRAQGIQKTLDLVRSRIHQAVPAGYSCSGTVLQVGLGVHEFAPSDHVACAGAGVDVALLPNSSPMLARKFLHELPIAAKGERDWSLVASCWSLEGEALGLFCSNATMLLLVLLSHTKPTKENVITTDVHINSLRTGSGCWRISLIMPLIIC